MGPQNLGLAHHEPYEDRRTMKSRQKIRANKRKAKRAAKERGRRARANR